MKVSKLTLLTTMLMGIGSYSHDFLDSAWGTTFFQQPIEVTEKEAPMVVRGTIESSQAYWVVDPDSSKKIYTYFDLNVSEVFKGSLEAPKKIRIRELGGEVGRVGYHVEGTAQFKIGEEVVLNLGSPLLKGTPEEVYPVQGLMMGKFNIKKDENGKEYLEGPALNSTAESHLHDPKVAGSDKGSSKNESQNDTYRKKHFYISDLKKIIQTQSKDSVITQENSSKIPPQPSLPSAQTVSNVTPKPQDSSLQITPSEAISSKSKADLSEIQYQKILLPLIILLLGVTLLVAVRWKNKS
jgi:hypothetical protein